MIRRPPRSTLDRSSAASDVYKRQARIRRGVDDVAAVVAEEHRRQGLAGIAADVDPDPVSYTHLRAHETVLDLVCRLLLEKKKTKTNECARRYKYYTTTKNLYTNYFS